MKKVKFKNVLSSAVAIAALMCLLTPAVNAYDIPAATLNEMGANVKHDSDSIKYDFDRREVEEDYYNYSRDMQDRKGTSGRSTVIQGNPANTDVIQARVDELETKGMYVSQIEVAASEILTREEIESVISKYAGKNLFISDIQEMINEINNLYAQKGFVTARAYLPEQQVENGSIYIGLIESRIGNVTVKNNRWTKTNYILDRIPDKETQLFDIVKLERDVLDFNRYNEGVRLSANLRAGEKKVLQILNYLLMKDFHSTLLVLWIMPAGEVQVP